MGKIYFLSDFHLGRKGLHTSKEREKILCNFLDEIKTDAEKIYLVGDLFDYWFEYKQVIPRQFTLFISKLQELRNLGILIEIFTGNHDMWMFGFFEDELDIPVHRDPIKVRLQGKRFFIAHGDGLGPGDYSYKIIKKVFRNKICQWLFARLHPNFALSVMKFFSDRSREINHEKFKFKGFDKEWLVQYCETHPDKSEIDYFIFGHRHLPIVYELNNNHSRYINLGDSLEYYSYAVLENESIDLKSFYHQDLEIHTNC